MLYFPDDSPVKVSTLDDGGVVTPRFPLLPQQCQQSGCDERRSGSRMDESRRRFGTYVKLYGLLTQTMKSVRATKLEAGLPDVFFQTTNPN
jgi:hypothetical protein